MDDFLYNVRTGNHKRMDGNRKQYNSYSNRGYDRQRGKEGKSGYTQRGAHQDQWPATKKTLEDISAYQKRIAEASERSARAAERQAEALVNISICLGHVPSPEVPVAADTDVDASAESSPEGEQPQHTPAETSAETDDERIIKMVLDMRKDNVSYVKIAARLSSMGVPTPSGRGQWRGHTVSRLCRQ